MSAPHFYCTKFCGWQGFHPADYFAPGNQDIETPDGYECRVCGAPAREGSICITCTIAPSLEHFDDCAACAAADLIHGDRDRLDSVRRIGAGKPWLRELETEIARLTSQPVVCGVQRREEIA